MEFPRISYFRIAFLLFLSLFGVSLFSQDPGLPEIPVQVEDPVKQETVSQGNHRIFRYNRLTLQENPLRAPGAIPKDFVPKGSTLLYSTELKSDRLLLENRESILILKNENSKRFVEGYYEALISLLGHKILQSQKSEKNSMYLVEVYNRKTVAISIHEEVSGTKIKLFQRSSSGGF